MPPQLQAKTEASEVFDTAGENAKLAIIFEDRYARIYSAVDGLVGSALQEAVDNFIMPSPEVERFLAQQMATRPIQVTSATRQAIGDMLARGMQSGYSAWELAYGKPKEGFPGIRGLYEETYRNRSLAIARTELQHSMVEASKERYIASGLVDSYRIVDGDASDEPCARRNGKVVPIAESPGLLHPNCTLGLIPVLTPASAVPPKVEPAGLMPRYETGGPVEFTTGADAISERARLAEKFKSVGKPMPSDMDLRKLAGCPDGVTMEVVVGTKAGLSWRHVPGRDESVGAVRYLEFDPAKKSMTLTNDLFAIEKGTRTAPGYGTTVFATQVDAARKLGVDSIEVVAAGSPLSKTWNGYYTWARLGYDAPLRSILRVGSPISTVGTEFAKAKTLNQLMTMPGGPAWWKENGNTFKGSFIPREDYAGYKMLKRYVAERGLPVTMKQAELGEKARSSSKVEQPPELTEDDEKLLDRIWADLAGEFE